MKGRARPFFNAGGNMCIIQHSLRTIWTPKNLGLDLRLYSLKESALQMSNLSVIHPLQTLQRMFPEFKPRRSPWVILVIMKKTTTKTGKNLVSIWPIYPISCHQYQRSKNYSENTCAPLCSLQQYSQHQNLEISVQE